MIEVQSIVTDILVASAALYIGRDLWSQMLPVRKLDKKNGESPCGSCNGCGPSKFEHSKLVNLSISAERPHHNLADLYTNEDKQLPAIYISLRHHDIDPG